MGNKLKRFMSLALALAMVLCCAPFTALAVGADAPDRPTATVTKLDNKALTFAMNFVADEVTEEQLAYYGDWFADFELTVNKDVTFNANGGADGFLSGQYDEWSKNWVNVPFENVTLKANEALKIMEYAAELMGEPGLKYTYGEVYEVVRDFNCGVFFTPEFLEANPDLEVTLELRMYNPEDESENYVIGETYVFTLEDLYVAYNINTEKYYNDADVAADEAVKGETVILIRNAKSSLLEVKDGVVFDLNGYTLDGIFVACFGHIIDSSDENTGLLKIVDKQLLIQDSNKQLPVYDNGDDACGYRFFEILKFPSTNRAVSDLEDANEYCFLPFFETIAHELIANGAEISGVSVGVYVTWTNAAGTKVERKLQFRDELVQEVITSYVENNQNYGKMFTLLIKSISSYAGDIEWTAYVKGVDNVTFYAANQ